MRARGVRAVVGPKRKGGRALRVGIVAGDPTVARGLRHLFARRGGIDVVVFDPPETRPAGEVGGAPSPAVDLLVLDVWPPSVASAERSCAEWHARQPGAVMVAVVHRPTDWLRSRLTRLGCTEVWPKESVRDLPEFALSLPGAGPA